MNKLAEKVKSLFTEDLVKLVIGFEKGSHGVRPFFCRNIEEQINWFGMTFVRIILQFI